jgi:hypothetical protein
MNGRVIKTNAVARGNNPGGAAAVAMYQRPFVLPVWEGWAGFGENECVCTEARLYLPTISSSAGTLTCSFEQDAFPVVVKFGRGAEE